MRLDESSLALRVRPNDLDSYGHVNNATALEYLEAGRWAWMEQHGLPLRRVSIIPVTTRVEVDYRKEITPQEVVVRTRLLEPAAEELDEPEAVHYRVRFEQRILVDSGQAVAVEALVHAAFLNAADRTLCSVQDFLAMARRPAP